MHEAQKDLRQCAQTSHPKRAGSPAPTGSANKPTQRQHIGESEYGSEPAQSATSAGRREHLRPEKRSIIKGLIKPLIEPSVACRDKCLLQRRHRAAGFDATIHEGQRSIWYFGQPITHTSARC